MLTDCPVGDSTVFKVDVLNDGTFDAKGSEIATIKDRDTDSENKFWERINLPVSSHAPVDIDKMIVFAEE